MSQNSNELIWYEHEEFYATEPTMSWRDLLKKNCTWMYVINTEDVILIPVGQSAVHWKDAEANEIVVAIPSGSWFVSGAGYEWHMVHELNAYDPFFDTDFGVEDMKEADRARKWDEEMEVGIHDSV